MRGIGEGQSRLEIFGPEQPLHTHRRIEHIVRPIGHERKVAIGINPLEVGRKILLSDRDRNSNFFQRLFDLNSRFLVLLASRNEAVEKMKSISAAIAS